MSEGESKTGNKSTLVDRLCTCLESKRNDGDSDDDAHDDGAGYGDSTGCDDGDDVTSPKTRFKTEAARR